MSVFSNLPTEVKKLFSNLYLALEPENLYQDGERSHKEADAEADRIFLEWRKLEKRHNVSVELHDVEDEIFSVY